MNDGRLLTDAVEKLARAEQEQVEDAIKAAILSGCDGVDVVRFGPSVQDVGDNAMSMPSTAQEIRTWTYDDGPPDPKHHERVTRYEWKWFDHDRLREAVASGNVMKYVKGGPDD